MVNSEHICSGKLLVQPIYARPNPSCRGSPFVPVAVAPVAKRVQLDFTRSQIRFPAGILRILFAYNSQTPGQSAGLGGVRAEGWLNQPASLTA